MSAPLFRPGEVADIRGITAPEYLFLNGTECTVVRGELLFSGVIDGTLISIIGYEVETCDGGRHVIRSCFLHKKRPPLGSWSDIRHIWQPKYDYRSELKAFERKAWIR